ncbi:MAG: S8 family serine peptidase [Sphingomonadales bacterium]|nr:S8 family serine peptidase [Sphingomonadales bacterium]
MRGLPGVGHTVDGALGNARELARATVEQAADHLRLVRLERVDGLLRRNHALIERDADGQPARRGTLLLIDPSPEMLARASALGFITGEPDRLDELDLSVIELTVPRGMDLATAQRLIARSVPGAMVASDALHFQSGGVGATARAQERPSGAGPIAAAVGLIDGAAAQDYAGTRGFAQGAPFPSNHGSAVAGLAVRAGVRNLLVADVYGRDPAGGNALAIVRGMNWLIGRGARVISISLVGPRNPLLERAVAAARNRKVAVVAAVGNDGPAAPPSFPASYPGVIAVTGVDRRNRPLIEAGRADHLDYAAPGADIAAPNAAGEDVSVRGTSYATPLVAARAAAALDRGIGYDQLAPALDVEARPLAKRLPDPRTGRGLLCETCR